MGIYGALSSAVAGLRAQAHALENISGNIANSQTTAYKRIETDFLDLIPDAPIKRQVPGAVLAQSRATNDVQGDIKTVSNETFIALNSGGFFIVEPKAGQSDGNSVFSGANYYTRRGDFEIDRDGYLVNGAGYYLKGLPIDRQSGNISGSVPEVISLSTNFLPAQATTRINYQANLPLVPNTGNSDPAQPFSDLMRSGDFVSGSVPATLGGGALTGTDPAAGVFVPGETVTLTINGTAYTFEFVNGGTPADGNIGVDVSGSVADALANLETSLRANGGPAAASATVGLSGGNFQITLGDNNLANFSVSGGSAATLANLGIASGQQVSAPVRPNVNSISAAQSANFLANSVSGGAVTAYAANGAPANVQLRWAKVDSYEAGGTDTWQLFYMSDSTATGAGTMWTRVDGDFTFGRNGAMLSPNADSINIPNLTVNGNNVGNVEFFHGSNGLSQSADVSGAVNVTTRNQNGYGAGEFVSVAISDSGRVVATYSNGVRIDVAQVVTANFNAANQLKRLDGGVYASTSESGEPIFDLAGSGIIGGALEASNTDISDEFTKLIVTQQAYAAGTRIVSTADEMLQEALNMVR
jgi:flagellar hook protein FlgE